VRGHRDKAGVIMQAHRTRGRGEGAMVSLQLIPERANPGMLG
jgi:hypothetical protein